MATSTTRTLEPATLRKVYLRLVLFCVLLCILCYIDRSNVSFAALTMNSDLGLTAYVYGLAAGAFFWGIACAPYGARNGSQHVGDVENKDLLCDACC